jgi:hypothetical protein
MAEADVVHVSVHRYRHPSLMSRRVHDSCFDGSAETFLAETTLPPIVECKDGLHNRSAFLPLRKLSGWLPRSSWCQANDLWRATGKHHAEMFVVTCQTQSPSGN